MKFLNFNIWDRKEHEWACITTNGTITKDHLAVMGAGCAKEASHKYPQLKKQLADAIDEHGNHVFVFDEYKLITFPVKHHWMQKADPHLIVRSSKELMLHLDEMPEIEKIYLPMPGCGNGKLQWHDINHLIKPILDDRVIVVYL